MMQINLLPWREQTRQVNRIRFIGLGTIIMGIACLIVLFTNLYFNAQLSAQQQLNDYVQSQINQEQGQQGTLNKKQDEKLNLETRLLVIKNLIIKNVMAIRLLNELNHITADNNVTLDKIFRNDHSIILSGSAETSENVNNFMKTLEHSPIFFQPVLKEIAVKQTEHNKNVFEIHVEQREPS